MPRLNYALLSPSHVKIALINHPQWQVLPHQRHYRIQRQFAFSNFKQAFGFITQVAMLAESMNHHPTWENTYQRVRISLHTHDAQGLTLKDVQLANAIDALLSQANAHTNEPQN